MTETVAPSYEQFREPVLRFLGTWTQCGEVIVIASSRAAADEWARAACAGALIGVHRLTLSQLAAALAARELAEWGATPVTRIVVEALAAKITDEALAADELPYFAPVARTPGFAGALARTLAGLRLDRVDAAALEFAGAPSADLARLLRRYADELRRCSLVDLADQYRASIQVAAAGRHPLCGLPVLVIDAAPEAALERELLDALAERAPAMLAVNRGASADEPASALASLQRYLFAADVPPRPADDSVDIFAASGEALECVEIARRILASARAGTPFDRMAILLRAPERYQPMVEEALRRAGVPGYYTRGSRRPYASGRAFLALLECAREGLSASRFAEYLSLGQFPRADAAEDDDPRPTPAPVYWERLLVDAAVIGGAARWQRRLEGLARSARSLADAAEDESEREAAERQVEQVEALAEFALPIIAQLEALPRRARWGEWLDALRALAESTLRCGDAVLALLDELQPMAEIEAAGLHDVMLVIEPALRSLRQPEEGPRYGQVWVAPIEQARGMAFDFVFLPGLNEGSFPRPPAEDPLLLDEYRARIPGARPQAREDNELLAIAAACACSRLVLSYSRLDLITGRQRVPSFYVFEALRAARGHAADVRDIEREAERGADTRIAWPAPPDPAQALDDAEFDLAVLRPAFDDPVTGRGAGAYLKMVNPYLVHSLRARGRRWRPKWFPEDGLTELDVHALQVLESYRLQRRPHSASALQQYAACPYRFALRAIFELHPAPERHQIQRMDAPLRGEIFHRAQFELFRELQDASALPVTAAGLPEALARLDAVLDGVARAFAEERSPAIPHVWAAEVESLRADLRGWLQQAAGDPQWTPVGFEFAFGMSPDGRHDPASRTEPVAVLDGVLLRGSIDLIERHASGILRVTDHKTGSAPAKAPQFVGAGEVLQPVIYALAAEAALGERVASGRLHYATLRQNFRAIDIPINDFARQRAAQVLRVIDDALHAGFLPAAPREDACRTCDYQSVCGPYEEERVARKSQAELRPLKDLRRLS